MKTGKPVLHALVTSHAPSLLDLLLTSHPDQYSVSVRVSLGSSDHCLVCTAVPYVAPPQPVEVKRRLWHYSSADWDGMREYFASIPWALRCFEDRDPSQSASAIAGEIILVETNAYQQIGQSTDNAMCIEMDLLHVGSEPVGMRCPHCQEDVMTKAHYRNTTLTHTVALIFGIFFWWLCCCIIPYVTKRWRNVEHYCPNCHRYLGVYSRSTIL